MFCRIHCSKSDKVAKSAFICVLLLDNWAKAVLASHGYGIKGCRSRKGVVMEVSYKNNI